MERRDALVALAGAIVLVVATLGVGLSAVGTSGPEYRLVVTEGGSKESSGSLGSASAATEASFEREVTLDALYIDAARLDVEVQATGPFPSGASALLRFVAPNGTAYEHEASAAAGESSIVLSIDVPSVPRPEATGLGTADEEEAREELARRLPEPVNGTWRIEVEFATAGPVPAPATSASWVLTHRAWFAEAAIDPPSR